MPTGIPLISPAGTTPAQIPAKFAGIVNTSEAYSASTSAFEPNFLGKTGVVGNIIKSTSSNALLIDCAIKSFACNAFL